MDDRDVVGEQLPLRREAVQVGRVPGDLGERAVLEHDEDDRRVGRWGAAAVDGEGELTLGDPRLSGTGDVVPEGVAVRGRVRDPRRAVEEEAGVDLLRRVEHLGRALLAGQRDRAVRPVDVERHRGAFGRRLVRPREDVSGLRGPAEDHDQRRCRESCRECCHQLPHAASPPRGSRSLPPAPRRVPSLTARPSPRSDYPATTRDVRSNCRWAASRTARASSAYPVALKCRPSDSRTSSTVSPSRWKAVYPPSGAANMSQVSR